MEETWIWSLIQEDATCHRATKPIHRNKWTWALEPSNRNCWACVVQLLKQACPRACAPQREAWALQQSSPCVLQPEKRLSSNEDPAQPKIRRIFLKAYIQSVKIQNLDLPSKYFQNPSTSHQLTTAALLWASIISSSDDCSIFFKWSHCCYPWPLSHLHALPNPETEVDYLRHKSSYVCQCSKALHWLSITSKVKTKLLMITYITCASPERHLDLLCCCIAVHSVSAPLATLPFL